MLKQETFRLDISKKKSHHKDTQAVGQGEAECPERLCSLHPQGFSRPDWMAQYNSSGNQED